MQVGKYIVFDFETWPVDKLVIKEVRAKVLSICTDPMKNCEPKCTVEINGEGYGIPFSSIKHVLPADNEQLILFE